MESSTIKVDNTLGAALIGLTVSSAVYGILTTQVYSYFRSYPADRVTYKLLVFSLWLLETVDQAFIAHAVYYFTITNYANAFALVEGVVPWTLLMQTALGALAGTVVKTCFALRVWRFSGRNWFITTVIILLALGQLGLAITYTYKTFKLDHLSSLPDIKLLGTISLAVGTLTDVVTAITLCFCLRKFRTGQRHSDTLVNSLTIYAINTGVLSSAFSLGTLVTYWLMPTNLIFIGIYFVLCKLYAVSFLATLNTRRLIVGTSKETDYIPSTLRMFQMVPFPGAINAADQAQVMTMKSFESPNLERRYTAHATTLDVAEIYSEGWS